MNLKVLLPFRIFAPKTGAPRNGVEPHAGPVGPLPPPRDSVPRPVPGALAAASGAPALVDHVRERVDHYLSPEGVERVLAEFDSLVALFPCTTFAAEVAR